jgi:hypothetical protein
VAYVRFDLALGAVAGASAWLLVAVVGVRQVALPVTLATVLGTALSILLAVLADNTPTLALVHRLGDAELTDHGPTTTARIDNTG